MSVLRGHSVFSFPPQRPMTADFEWFLSQMLSITFFSYFKHVYILQRNKLYMILIMLLFTDVCVRMVFVWEETGVPGGNPPVWLGDHMTISHADAGYQIRVVAVRGECVNNAPVRQPFNYWKLVFNKICPINKTSRDYVLFMKSKVKFIVAYEMLL